MLKRKRQTMLLVRTGLTISILLNVLVVKWRLPYVVVEVPVDGDSLFPSITSWAVATGVLEAISAAKYD